MILPLALNPTQKLYWYKKRGGEDEERTSQGSSKKNLMI
jgi:hypothetical protein